MQKQDRCPVGRRVRTDTAVTGVLGRFIALAAALAVLGACERPSAKAPATVEITDQLDRQVVLPARIDRVAALHHFGGKIVYALGQQDKLVEQSIYGSEAKALAAVDPQFAAMPKFQQGANANVESLVALKPQVVFVYASFGRAEMTLLENAGLRVVAVRGERLEESFAAVELVGKVLNCPEKARRYVAACRQIVDLVARRITDIAPSERARVLFAGPKSAYTAATGEMLQTEIIERAGGFNVAGGLKGFWADISPEQVAAWNPDVIFLGSYLGSYSIDNILQDSQFAMVAAVHNKRIYAFPSNIGWWDYPAPHCALGILWTAKALYPERFGDVDVLKTADDFYGEFMGHTFTEMGGRL
jgi:iron complex transport system substrate-binding protein